MMNRYGFAVLIVIVLFAAIPMASAADAATLYFNPQHGCVPEGGNMTVEVWFDIPAGVEVDFGQFGFDYDPACGDIVDRQYNTDIMTGLDPSWSFWNSIYSTDCWDSDTEWIVFDFWIPKTGPVQAMVGNFTIHCNSTKYCVSELNFSCKPGCIAGCIIIGDRNGDEQSINLSNGTFECGTPSSAEDFSKPLYEGWNLISLPLDPEDSSAGAVLSTVAYNALYQYNAESKQFESIDSSDAMNPGTGYFVYATGDCTWDYSGYAYTSMDISLEQGLNMVGWLNCSKDVDDALSSISGDYRYVARWNTSAQKFEVYNPKAPSEFNDVTTMDRGTGYFISAKQSCTLSEEC